MPIPDPSDEQRSRADIATQAITQLSQALHVSSANVLDVLRIEYDVENIGHSLADFFELTSDEFVREVKKRRAKGASPLSPAGLKALRALYETAVPPLLEQCSQILSLDRTIVDAVHAAYKLTEEDLRLLRATQLPRMPPGW